MKAALAIGTCVLCWPALALAQTPSPAAVIDPAAPSPLGVHVVDDAESKPPLVPRAKDLLGGHLLLGASAAPLWSLGKLGSDMAAVRGLGTGVGFNLDAGIGLSRNVAVGLWGSLARYSNGDACGSCDGQSLAVGPFVRYHLSQGLRFDPWLSLGAGYRQVNFEQDGVVGPARPDVQAKFSGVQWLRLELGADYYVWSGLGLGPYAGLGLSSYTKRPENAGDASVNTELSVGLRFLLDVPGR